MCCRQLLIFVVWSCVVDPVSVTYCSPQRDCWEYLPRSTRPQGFPKCVDSARSRRRNSHCNGLRISRRFSVGFPPFIAALTIENSAGVIRRPCLPVRSRSYQVLRTSSKTPLQTATNPKSHHLRFLHSNLSLHNRRVQHLYSTDFQYIVPFNIAPMTIFCPPRP